MTVVVDASVAYKWYVAEQDTAAAWAIVESSDAVIAPELVVAEVCNAAWKAHRKGEISAAQQARIADDVVQAFDRLEALGPFAARASAIAREIDHPVDDCFYLALSEVLDAPLVTADGRLITRTVGTAFAARTIDLSVYQPRG